MKFRLIIDKEKEEEIVITAREESPLIHEIESLILNHTSSDRIPGYTEDTIKMLSVNEIECITVIDGKTFAIDSQMCQYRLKQRLYELEKWLPSYFIRINKKAHWQTRRILNNSKPHTQAV